MHQRQKDDLLVIIIIVVVLIIGGSMIYRRVYSQQAGVEIKAKKSVEKVKAKEPQPKEYKTKAKKVVVHMGGEVINPGVYRCNKNSRLYTILNKAGGPTNQANLNAINLAGEVRDGQKIIIPSIKKELSASGSEGAKKININTAKQSQLEEITGVGEVTAEKIINYRKNNGQFKELSNLTKVSGIGPKTLEKIKTEITY